MGYRGRVRLEAEGGRRKAEGGGRRAEGGGRRPNMDLLEKRAVTAPADTPHHSSLWRFSRLPLADAEIVNTVASIKMTG